MVWDEFTAKQEVAVLMRFSYFGLSGWKSEFSRDKALLFSQDRLMMRLALLESLGLPSLAAQSDQNFHLAILTSTDLPDWAMAGLNDACSRILGKGKFRVLPRGEGTALIHFNWYLAKRYGEGRTVQMVLDDDDALSCDFIARARAALATLPPVEGPQDMRFVSFARGFGLDVSEGEAQLYAHRYPFINLGLTMVGPETGRSIFSIEHRKTPKEHPHALIGEDPMFVRSLHGNNDSRISVTERWKPVAGWREDAQILARFPYLAMI